MVQLLNTLTTRQISVSLVLVDSTRYFPRLRQQKHNNKQDSTTTAAVLSRSDSIVDRR